VSSSATVGLDTVTSWLDAGRTLEEIERELLDPAPLGEEQRAALWLYAWSQKRGHDRIDRPLGRRLPDDPGT
jgi:hypothetical protein